MKTVMVGERRFRLPFLDLIPFDEKQNASLGEAICQDARVHVPVVCWKEKKTSSEDTVIDGAHRCEWASIHKLDRVPVVYRSFDSEEEAKAECERLNLDRRHLSPEMQHTLRERRVERVAKLRAEGETIDNIAEKEGISASQAQRDLHKSGEVHPPGGPDVPLCQICGLRHPDKITGRDGKLHPAHKPSDVARQLLCKRCQRLGRPVKDCTACERAKKDAAKKKTAAKKRKTDEAEKVDCFKNPVPAKRQDALFDPWIQKAIDFLAETSESFRQERLMDQMHKKAKHYPFFHEKDFVDGCGFVIQYLDDLISHLKDNRPAAVCPKCSGDGCGMCKMSGLVTREVYEESKK